MTVKVSKPKFNIREKLSELDKPSGVKGNQLLRSETAQDARNAIGAGRKNMIINGAMNINQRNETSSYTIPHATGGSYGGPDRWAVNEATDGSISVNMDGDPAGGNGDGSDVQEFTRAFQLACTGTAALSSSHNVHFFQNIEGYNIVGLGWGTTAAKPVTLSFWVRTNKSGTYAVGLENSGTNRCCIKDYEQKGDFKWNKVVLTFPGCTDGTWDTTHGCGMRVRFCLASGVQYDDGVDGKWVTTDELCTTKSQIVNFMDSTNNRFFITGVQLEEGTIATEFEHRSHGAELLLCHRYYIKIYTNTSDYPFGVGYKYSSGAYAVSVPLPTKLRSTPGATFSGLRIRGGHTGGSNTEDDVTGLGGMAYSNSNFQSFTANSSTNNTSIGQTVVLTNSVSNNTSYIAFDAEL